MSENTPQNNEIVYKYNEIKQKYTIFFQKALELEDELREHNLVANTLSTVESDRRCWRMVGGVLVEKNVDLVRKEMDVQIANIKQTLEIVHKTLKTQEGVLKEFERKYATLLKPQQAKDGKVEKANEGSRSGGVLA